jgi:uncharacterized membrane protein required for colicin V production
MKTVLILLGAGVIGLIGGAIPGYLTGRPVGFGTGALSGVCEVSDAAVLAKVLTVDQAEQLGKAVSPKIPASDVANFTKYIPQVGDGCKRLIKGVSKGA